MSDYIKTVTIDSREDSKWHWSLAFPIYGYMPEVSPLSVGDFLLVCQGEPWFIELKKSPSDIEASFFDGRLSAQVNRADNRRFAILLEGDLNMSAYSLNIDHALAEAQSMGVFIFHCGAGQVIQKLVDMHEWLNKQDHAYFRRPVAPMPSMLRYSSRDFMERVRTLTTYPGIGEVTAVAALKAFSLDQINDNPRILMPLLSRNKVPTINAIYKHLGKIAPYIEEPQKSIRATTRQSTRTRRTEVVLNEGMTDALQVSI